VTPMRSGVALQAVDDPDVFEQYVDEIEALGFDQLWLTDSSLHSRNPYVYLTLAARRTTRLTLGTAVTNPVTRHPAVTAVAISSVDVVAGGRAILGIGAGDRPLLSLGLKPAPLSQLEDAVAAIRRLLTGETVDLTGHGFALTDAHMRVQGRSDIPIFMSASGPKTLELAGRIADGVILLGGLHPEGLRWAIDHIDRGVDIAGRSARPPVTVFAYGAVDEDEQEAVAAGRTIAAWFPQTAPVYCQMAGLSAELIDRIRRSYRGGEFQEAEAAAALLPLDFVQRMALCGGVASARAHIRNLSDLGVDAITVFPLSKDRMATVRGFIQAFEAELRGGGGCDDRSSN
jgi:5,10-methylenetetrahydromethanopterin reductase